MIYSFCVQATQPSCLEGFGAIPNAAFTGHITANIKKAEVLKVVFDTTTLGFVNELCLAPDTSGNCTQGTSPATGGLISMKFTKKRGDINTLSSTVFEERDFKVTGNFTDAVSEFTDSSEGTVIGTNVAQGGGMSLETIAIQTSATDSRIQQVHSMLEKATLERSVSPQALRRIERLRSRLGPR